MDYNEIIEAMRSTDAQVVFCYSTAAANALETLLAERDAAVEDLVMAGDCKTCGNVTTWCMGNPDGCKGYKWRGPQKGD